MTGVLLGLVAGAVMVRLLLRATAPLLSSEALLRTNHRGALLPGSTGVLVPLAALVASGLLALGSSYPPAGGRAEVLLAALGFAALGFFDDVAGGPSVRGLRGHLRAMARGHLTTGGVKLLGGIALSVFIARSVDGPVGPLLLLADGALVALSANLTNALDLAPGRALKVACVTYLPLAVVAGVGPPGLALAPVAGAAFGLLPDDLGERLMLGDSGANAIGAAFGTAALLTLSPGARLALLLALVGFTLLAEATSLSRLIDRVEVLRRLDRLGRHP